MNNLKEIISKIYLSSRIDIGNIKPNIMPHWAYYIAGSIFLVLTIISIIYTYYYMTHPFPKKNLDELHGLKKFWLKNRLAFFLMIDVICILSTILFMMNGS